MPEKVKPTYGVTRESTALSYSTSGITPDNWVKAAAEGVYDSLKSGVRSLKDLAGKMWDGAKEVWAALRRGDIELFYEFASEQPVAALAGGLAVVVGGWFLAGASGLTAMVAGGVGAFWATLGGLSLGGVTVGAMLPSLRQVIVGGGTTLMNLDWMQSDKSILAELEGAYLGFLNNVGESAGRMIVAIALGGARKNPRLTLNISAAAALSITKEIEDGENISDELIESMAEIANIFIRYARNLAGKLGYLQLRKWARKNVKTGNKWLDAKIENWGLTEGQSFSISSKIDDKIEKITEENKPLGNFLEGLKDGMSEGFSELIVLT